MTAKPFACGIKGILGFSEISEKGIRVDSPRVFEKFFLIFQKNGPFLGLKPFACGLKGYFYS